MYVIPWFMRFSLRRKRILKWKYGLEPMPEKVKPKTLEDVKKEDEALAKAKAEAQKKSA